MVNPYINQGKAATKIKDVLKKLKIDKYLISKEFLGVDFSLEDEDGP